MRSAMPTGNFPRAFRNPLDSISVLLQNILKGHPSLQGGNTINSLNPTRKLLVDDNRVICTFSGHIYKSSICENQIAGMSYSIHWVYDVYWDSSIIVMTAGLVKMVSACMFQSPKTKVRGFSNTSPNIKSIRSGKEIVGQRNGHYTDRIPTYFL